MFIYFILGIIFIEVFLPILESIIGLIATYIEVLKGKMSIRIAEINIQLEQIKDTTTINNKKAYSIGFKIPDSNDKEDENVD